MILQIDNQSLRAPLTLDGSWQFSSLLLVLKIIENIPDDDDFILVCQQRLVIITRIMMTMIMVTDMITGTVIMMTEMMTETVIMMTEMITGTVGVTSMRVRITFPTA